MPIERTAGLTAGVATMAVVLAMLASPIARQPWLLPVSLAAVVGGGGILAQACRGRWWALNLLVGLLTVGISLNFRDRPIGEVGLDLQNGSKLVVWSAVFGVAMIRLPAIGGLLRRFPMLCLLLYGAVAMASSAWSPTPAYSFGCAFGLTAYLLFAAVVGEAMPTPEIIRPLTWWLGAFVLLSAISLPVLPDIALAPPDPLEPIRRLQGLSGQPNQLGHQMASVILVMVVAAARRVTGPVRLAAIGLGAAVLLLATQSRSSILAVAGALLITLLRRRPLLWSAFLLLAVALALAAPDHGSDLLARVSRSGDKSEVMTLTGRTDIWSCILGKIAERPFFGYGFNATEAVMTKECWTEASGAAFNAHSMILQCLFGVGLVGSLPLFLFFGWCFHQFLANPVLERDLCFWAQMISGLVEVDTFGGTPTMFTLIFLLLLCAVVRR